MGQSPPGSTVGASGGTPLLNGPTDFGNRHPTPTQFTRNGRKFAKPGDILFCVRGSTTGRMNWANQTYTIGRGIAAIRHRSEPSLQHFLRAVLEDGLRELLPQATGSTFPNISAHQLAALRLPEIDNLQQHTIARIFSTLDDRIELNRGMCETLEAMAQALFKSWFVDFDPVRAKMEGRDTGLPEEIADLFPDCVVASSLGPVPHGWQSLRLGELAHVVRGRSYRSSELVKSDTALVTLKSFARGGGYRPDGLKPYVGKYNSEQIVQPGELVLACTDVTQAAEIVGRPAIVTPDQRYTTLVASLDTLIIRPPGALPNLIPFLYHLTNSPSFVHYAYAHVSGTTVLHLNRKAIPAFEFPSPPSNLIHAYATLATPLHHRILQISTESAVLVELRDALLPRLMSRNRRVCKKDVDSLECGAVNC